MERLTLLVDLDGTITDPARGILTSIQHAITGVGFPAPPQSDLHWVIGPPLRISLPQLGVPQERVAEAIALYRDRYVNGGGMYEAELIDGMADALRALKGQGIRLFVATSKPHIYAKPIIAHFGLADVFEAVHGAELDGRNDAKKDVIASILTTHDVAPENCIMVGDTVFDVEGARFHAIPTIGCAWGAARVALLAASPALVIQRADELPEAVAKLAG